MWGKDEVRGGENICKRREPHTHNALVCSCTCVGDSLVRGRNGTKDSTTTTVGTLDSQRRKRWTPFLLTSQNAIEFANFPALLSCSVAASFAGSFNLAPAF